MIITFIDNPEFINTISYYYSNREITTLNLSSFYSGYIDITDLITKISPINNTGMQMPEFVNSVQFDIQYASALMNNPDLFTNLLDIMLRAYEGQIICILVQRDPYRDAIMESLIKFIQQRYGYNCWIIEDNEDISCITEGTLTPSGLITLDNDIIKYKSSYTNGLSHQILSNINLE